MKNKERSADTPNNMGDLHMRRPKWKKPFSKATYGMTVSLCDTLEKAGTTGTQEKCRHAAPSRG